MEKRGIANNVDDVFDDSWGNGVAEELRSESPSKDMSSSTSGFPSYASLLLPSASKVNANDGRDVARGSVGLTKILEHAPPGEQMLPPGLRMAALLDRPPDVFASNHDVAPGAFAIVPSSRNTATRRTLRPPISSYDSTIHFVNEESKQEEGPSNCAGVDTGARDSNSMGAGSDLYAVDAQLVTGGNERGTTVIAEAKSVTVKLYQQPLLRWILACCLVGAVVAIVVIVVRPPSAASTSSLTPPTPIAITRAPSIPDPALAERTSKPVMAPTTVTVAPPSSKPMSLTPVVIACSFLSIPNVTKCRSTFEAYDTTGSTIPSEIGLLTQMTHLSFLDNSLRSKIPSEIGLLTQLLYLTFWNNSLTSKIPSEIGLLTQLTFLSFSVNELTSTIPSDIGLLTQLASLDFHDNLLNSTIPSEIGLLTKMERLDFTLNRLTSKIPSEIGLLTLTTVLDFGENSLNSTIPSEIGLLTRLKRLSFWGNLLSSAIPSEIGLLAQLEYLHFGSNELISSIPSEIGLLTKLTELYLFNNLLSSTIPSEIGRLTHLSVLDIYNNLLKGTIPSSLCSFSIYIDCGEITCDAGCCLDATGGSSCG